MLCGMETDDMKKFTQGGETHTLTRGRVKVENQDGYRY